MPKHLVFSDSGKILLSTKFSRNIVGNNNGDICLNNTDMYLLLTSSNNFLLLHLSIKRIQLIYHFHHCTSFAFYY